MPVTHPSARDCRHQSTVSVISDGLEEVICEDCGHVSIRYESMIQHDLKRSQFTRRGGLLSGENGERPQGQRGSVGSE